MTIIELKNLKIQEEIQLNELKVGVEYPKTGTITKPLTVTKNGVYKGGVEDGESVVFNPVTVNIERSIKKYLEAGGTFGNQQIEDFRPLLEYSDTENLENIHNMFARNSKLKYVPMLDFRKATSTYYMFSQCSALEEIPLFELSNNGDFQGMFRECLALKVVPAYDMRSAWSLGYMLHSCTNLEEIWVRNINVALTVGSGSTYGHLLKVECLIHLIYELRYHKATRTLTMGNVNLEKLANVYVRLVEITDEMRAKDDLIDEKLPFEVCESTDEGATQIVQYAKFKNWNIA